MSDCSCGQDTAVTLACSGGPNVVQITNEVAMRRMGKVLNRSHCKPVFEWGTDMDFRPSGPPDSHEGRRAK